MLENGFDVAGFRSKRSCVKPHRKPEKKAAEMTRMKPSSLNSTSPDTMRMTPNVIVAMMATNRHVGGSRRKRKAKSSTNASEDDLHMARSMQLASGGTGQIGAGVAAVKRTVKRECNGL